MLVISITGYPRAESKEILKHLTELNPRMLDPLHFSNTVLTKLRPGNLGRKIGKEEGTEQSVFTAQVSKKPE